MPSEKAQSYLQQKKIPELFQSLTIALLYNQPKDHIDYLIKRLDEVKEMGYDNVLWDTFLPDDRHSHGREFQVAAPLPPLHGTLVAGTRQY